jgi:transposase InsO family protein
MDERTRFIGDCLSGEWTMIELCERYGISRKTGYKWLERYYEHGPGGLAERSHAPFKHGRATPKAVADAIIALRRERMSWGPKKIVAKLSAAAPDAAWPAASTAGEILKRAGLVTGRRLRRRVPPTPGGLKAPLGPNQLWAADHKGWVRLGDGTRCEPLTITDGFSRYLVQLSAGRSTREAEARPLFEQAFSGFGLPEAIRTDNGPPFASPGATGLTALSVWWLKLGIRHERIAPGHPQQNGRHERFHLTLLHAMQPQAANAAEQQRRFQEFAKDYNEERPHEALGQQPPSAFYRPSARPFPDKLEEPCYPPEAAVRKVRSNGEIKWEGNLVALSQALAGEAVALEETEAGDWLVRFYAAPIGMIRRGEGRLSRLKEGATP